MRIVSPDTILDFWFAAENRVSWFESSAGFDAEIVRRFSSVYEQAKSGALDGWQDTPESMLALVIVLDQFPRHMFRGSPQAFATDAQALAIAKQAVAQGFDSKLNDNQRRFLYMPFMHSEDLTIQEQGTELFAGLGNPDALNYMQRHRDIIARFGRFPHRNAVLGRHSTPEEVAFLSQPGSSF